MSPTTSGPGPAAISRRQVLERYRHLREDHLRYMQQWGIIRPSHRAHGETYYAFADLALLRQADAELGSGASFRAVLRALVASRSGQLTLDFRRDAAPAKVLQLKRPDPPPLAELMQGPRAVTPTSAEQHFLAASLMDDGHAAHVEAAAAGYRRALTIDPELVPALINLANIHYGRDEIIEAQVLYERAVAIDPEVFEAHFNLGNVLHDLGRYTQAQECYRQALRLQPAFADAHFYLAVTLEKSGQSQAARPHWKAYQQLAPDGEWVHLAREFSD